MIPLDDSLPCPCGSASNYAQCCGRYIDGEESAPSAEALMRSRFTAFARKNEAYLLASWDSTTRPQQINLTEDVAEWQTLEIVSVKKGKAGDSKGVVEFKAYYLLDSEQHVMSEISRFRKIDGSWYYLDGKVKSISKTGGPVNQGKNAPCPCGSGKKYKRCCAKN